MKIAWPVYQIKRRSDWCGAAQRDGIVVRRGNDMRMANNNEVKSIPPHNIVSPKMNTASCSGLKHSVERSETSTLSKLSSRKVDIVPTRQYVAVVLVNWKATNATNAHHTTLAVAPSTFKIPLHARSNSRNWATGPIVKTPTTLHP